MKIFKLKYRLEAGGGFGELTARVLYNIMLNNILFDKKTQVLKKKFVTNKVNRFLF